MGSPSISAPPPRHPPPPKTIRHTIYHRYGGGFFSRCRRGGKCFVFAVSPCTGTVLYRNRRGLGSPSISAPPPATLPPTQQYVTLCVICCVGAWGGYGGPFLSLFL